MKVVITAALMVPALTLPHGASGQPPSPDPLHARLDRAAAQAVPDVIE